MKLRFIVLFSLLFGCMFFTSVSYAWTLDDFIYFIGTVKEDTNQFDRSINIILNNETKLRQFVGNTNFSSFVCTNPNINGGYTTLHFVLNPVQITSNNGSNINFNFTDSNSANRCVKFEINYSTGNVTKTQWQSLSSFPLSGYGLVESSNNWTNWGNGYYNNKYVAPYTGPVFTPSNNGTIQVIAPNNQTENMIRLPFSYTGQSNWTLGYLTDYEDVYQIHGYFGPMLFVSGELYTDSDSNTFIYSSDAGTFNNGLSFDSSTGRISIRKERLLNQQAYNLYLSYNLTSNSITEDITEVNYYSYFFNLNLSSGDLMSPDVNSNTDITMINALTEFLENNENTDFIIDNTFPSGDIFSGDLPFGIIYQNFDNFGFGDFVYSFFYNLYTILSNYNDVTINFGFLGDISSSVFSVSDNVAFTFIGAFSTIFFIIMMILFYYRLFKAISTLDITKLFKFDFDSMFNLF